MIEDISIHGDFFDPDFFVYREDADVAWRAQLLGWKCLYTPRGLGYHVRSVLPGNRAALDPMINMHSVKNRFLMRIKNMTPGVFRKCFVPTTLRDGVVFIACLVKEQSSLRGLAFVAKNWSAFREKRAEIMRRRRVDDAYMTQWFAFEPASIPAPKLAARELRTVTKAATRLRAANR